MKKTGILIISLFSLILLYLIFPYFLKVELKKIPLSTIIYDDKNNEIGEIIFDKKYRHRETSFNEIPDFLKNALISIEDKRFYYHSGIDYIGIIRALKNNIFGNSVQGASTIDNQVIRNSYWLNENRGYKLKIKEFVLSLALNKKYSKNEILNYYLNNINFGYLNYGIASASVFYYNKDIKNLTKAEMLGLITIIKNPNKYNPITNLSNFNKRFKILVNYLEKNGVISKEEKTSILQEKLIFFTGEKNKLPYIVDFINNKSFLENNSKGSIFTTISYDLTKKIDELAKSSIKSLAWKNVSNYSIIIIDRNTLDLKVMIGGNDYYSKDGQVNGSLALRQPGSALKPFIYLLAFQDLNKTSSSTILDLPVNYKTIDGYSYEPKNYSLDYKGEISLAQSLSQSINIPAVKLLNEIGIEKFLIFLRSIKINSLNKNSDFYGLSLALGSGEVSLYELTRAYLIFAKGGNLCDVNYIEKNKANCKKITDKKYTAMVEEILTNRYFKLAGFPINSNLDFENREVFVKTGTSRNFKDNLSIGYTSNYIIGVWVGNKDGSEMKGVSGSTGAGDIFRKIVYFLDDKDINSSVISLNKDKKDYLEITSPLDKSMFKVNPFIPLKNQDIKLSFSTNVYYDSFSWYLNGEKIDSNFINITKFLKKNNLKVEIYKSGEMVGSDEVLVEVEKK
ncbi:transglycosylase domain-containing protein [Candidatus Gracilibacteria bacterium]|nr:transglycosylase domain-containing protein [Candidatus Gracilibacteria bacterium]